MIAKSSAPPAQEKRLSAYMEWLAPAVGHADRLEPFRNYSIGLLLEGERKSVEPMAARLAPDHIQSMHESLHHFVAKSSWSDAEMLKRVRNYVLPTMQKIGPVTAWVVDETGMVKKGRHSVGVARQYCGRVGKTESCQVAVSLSVATATASLPIAWRLYLPEEEWANNPERRAAVGVPKELQFQTKPQIALGQIRQAVQDGVAPGVVLGDEVYGSNREFRDGVVELNLNYSLAVRSNTTVRVLERQSRLPQSGKKRRSRRIRREPTSSLPLTVKHCALQLPEKAWRTVTWREGSQEMLSSRFAALRVRPAYADDPQGEKQLEQWLLMEWPRSATEPVGYWLARLPVTTSRKRLVGISKHRWVIERDYQELKSELGLAHYEGRNWRGFHHHATLCIAAYGFLISERSRFSPSAHVGDLRLRTPRIPSHFRPRGAKGTSPTA